MQNDKLALLRRGSLQHSGDNLLPFLREVATLPDLAVRNSTFPNEFSNMEVVYFDILVSSTCFVSNICFGIFLTFLSSDELYQYARNSD
jgi:hypothetical protein